MASVGDAHQVDDELVGILEVPAGHRVNRKSRPELNDQMPYLGVMCAQLLDELVELRYFLGIGCCLTVADRDDQHAVAELGEGSGIACSAQGFFAAPQVLGAVFDGGYGRRDRLGKMVPALVVPLQCIHQVAPGMRGRAETEYGFATASPRPVSVHRTRNYIAVIRLQTEPHR